MNETFDDSWSFFKKQLWLDLPEDLSKKDDAETHGSLQTFIDAPRTQVPDRALLLDLVQQFPCSMNPNDGLWEAVANADSRLPGFSNKPPEKHTFSDVKATIAQQNIVAALVIKEQAQDKSYKHHIIARDIARNVVAHCEDQLINGTAGIKGLLHVRGATSIAINYQDETQISFYWRALREYASKAGRTPTHIVLPFGEIMWLHVGKRNDEFAHVGKDAQGLPNALFGIPVIVSDALPRERGLILTVDDIVLASFPGVKWAFGRENTTLKENKLSAIIISFIMGLLIKHPRAVAQLTLERKGS